METCSQSCIPPPQFDLVCGKEQNSESMQTMFAAGILTGSLIFGLMSDK